MANLDHGRLIFSMPATRFVILACATRFSAILQRKYHSMLRNRRYHSPNTDCGREGKEHSSTRSKIRH
jgi:hypothetical protein